MTVVFDLLPAAIAAGAASAGAGAAAAGAGAGIVGGAAAAGAGTAISAGAVAGGAAAAGGILGTGIAVGDILAGASAIGTVLTTVGEGAAARERAKTEAAFLRTQAEQEVAAGAEAARRAAREYREISAAQDVVFLANGLDIGVGTPVNVKEATRREADRNLDIMRTNVTNRAAARRLRSRGLLSEGRAALASSVARSVPTLSRTYEVLG